MLLFKIYIKQLMGKLEYGNVNEEGKKYGEWRAGGGMRVTILSINTIFPF